MQTVSITIDSADQKAFERIYWACIRQARPRQPGELVVSFVLPPLQSVGTSKVYRDVPAWLLEKALAQALRDEGMAFDVA